MCVCVCVFVCLSVGLRLTAVCNFLRQGSESILFSTIQSLTNSVDEASSVWRDSSVDEASMDNATTPLVSRETIKSTVKGAAQVLLALQDATAEIVQSAGEAAADVLQHRYGENVGLAARRTVNTISHVRCISLQMNRLVLETIASLASSPQPS